MVFQAVSYMFVTFLQAETLRNPLRDSEQRLVHTIQAAPHLQAGGLGEPE